MGQKVNPISLRIGINRLWDSKWYANKKKYGKTLHQDFAIENAIREKLKDASVSKIEILRTSNAVTINVHSAKPGLIIGRGGETIEKLREFLDKKFGGKFSVNIMEIKQPNMDAHLVGESIVKQIERRISYRRVAKMAIDRSLEAGALGVKVKVAGRLNGVEIARNEFFSKGKIPLHTFRADIDYAYLPANTTYGIIGVKVWIYKGDVFKKDIEVQMTGSPLPEEEKKAPAKKVENKPKAKKPVKKTTKKK
ncbi:30S ribosomal protein S3 [bacterium]|nr:30S ribosomal protein S3 [bacterium]